MAAAGSASTRGGRLGESFSQYVVLKALKHNFVFCRCRCNQGMCGKECAQADPCIAVPNICENGGICIEDCDREHRYKCNCTVGFIGVNCSEQVSV